MRFFIDKITRKFVKAANDSALVTRADYKRGDDGRIEVQFVSGGSVVELATGATGKFAMKEAGKYDGEIIVGALSWAKEGTGASTIYVFEPSLNVEALDDLLGSGDDDDTNDIAFIDLMQEIEWIESGLISSTNTIDARVHNDVIKGTEGTPAELPTPDADWLAHGHAQTLTVSQKQTATGNAGAVTRLLECVDGDAGVTITAASDGKVYDFSGVAAAVTLSDPSTYVGTRFGIRRYGATPSYPTITSVGPGGAVFSMFDRSNPITDFSAYPEFLILEALPMDDGGGVQWVVTSTPKYPIGWNADQSKWQKITIIDGAGVETISISDL